MSIDVLQKVASLALHGLNPTPVVEEVYAYTVYHGHKVLELYEGDRVRIWALAKFPLIPLSSIFPEWSTLSKTKQQLCITATRFLATYKRPFLEYHPNLKDFFDEKWRGVYCFHIGVEHAKNCGLLSDILMQDDDFINRLLALKVQWFIF